MVGVHPDLRKALGRGGGVVARLAHPELRHALDWAVRCRDLVPVLYGVYATPDDATTLLTRARAASLRDRRCVVVRESAAALLGWREFPEPADLQVASTRLRERPGFRVERRAVPRRLARRVDGVLVTSRALTALDLVDVHGPGAIDDALRRGVSLADLSQAVNLVPHRRGHLARRRLIAESGGRPFSPAERRAHTLLRAAGVVGWVGNREFRSADGFVVSVGDLVFEEWGMILEIDGRQHLQPEAILRDRARDLWLGTQGWAVYRVEAGMLLHDPVAFVRLVGDLLAGRSLALHRGSGGSAPAGAA